jgi:outer membrane protein OmpA-like peptidoglycan-associated protein
MKRLGLRLHADEEHWIPLSDLMTGLMFLFLLIALAYMVEVRYDVPGSRAVDASIRRRQAAVAYVQTRSQLYQALRREFAPDLLTWGASIDENTLSVHFNSPDVLFMKGSAALRPHFKTILDSFFPRYVRILNEPNYRRMISEIRIEGYTSTGWSSGASEIDSYLGNMDLSTARARAVLGYVLPLPGVSSDRGWLVQVLTATGLSSSHVRYNADGSVNEAASQRVEFRIETNADANLRAIANASQTIQTAQAAVAPSAPPAQAAARLPITGLPAWATPFIGKNVDAGFPKASSRCKGFMDNVTTDSPSGAAVVSGWAFDLQAQQAVNQILIVDAKGVVVGAGEGGLQRLDVPAVQPEIHSETTGWQAFVERPVHGATAWALLRAPHTACRLTGVAF